MDRVMELKSKTGRPKPKLAPRKGTENEARKERSTLKVPGTAWSAMRTKGSGRAYFHNAATRESTWRVPAEFADHPEIAKMKVASKKTSTTAEAAEAEYRSNFLWRKVPG